MLRRAFRYFFPRRKHPLMDALLTPSARDYENESRYQAVVGTADAFISARYAEGMRWRPVLDSYLRPRARLLDIGAGNGAIELALAAGGYRVVSIEADWND